MVVSDARVLEHPLQMADHLCGLQLGPTRRDERLVHVQSDREGALDAGKAGKTRRQETWLGATGPDHVLQGALGSCEGGHDPVSCHLGHPRSLRGQAKGRHGFVHDLRASLPCREPGFAPPGHTARRDPRLAGPLLPLENVVRSWQGRGREAALVWRPTAWSDHLTAMASRPGRRSGRDR